MRQHASKVLQSNIPVELKDGAICDSKDTRDIDELEKTNTPANGQVGIRPSPLRKVMRSIVQLNCIYTNACKHGQQRGGHGAVEPSEKCTVVDLKKKTTYR